MSDDECEVPDMLMEVGEGNLDGCDIEPREELALFLGFKVVEDDACEVGDNDIAGDFVLAA